MIERSPKKGALIVLAHQRLSGIANLHRSEAESQRALQHQAIGRYTNCSAFGDRARQWHVGAALFLFATGAKSDLAVDIQRDRGVGLFTEA